LIVSQTVEAYGIEIIIFSHNLVEVLQ